MSLAAGTASGSFIVGAAFLGPSISPDVAPFAAAASYYAFVVSGALSGVAMIGAAALIFRTGAFSRSMAAGLVGLLAIGGSAAVAHNSPTGIFSSINAFAWFAYFLWGGDANLVESVEGGVVDGLIARGTGTLSGQSSTSALSRQLCGCLGCSR
jgi:hypothetical protein